MTRKLRHIRGCAIGLVGALLIFALQPTTAQEAKPQETKGVTVDSKIVLGLAPQIPELKGYVLRVRKITMEPGAVIAHHSHEARPVAAYVVSGEFTEVRDDSPEIIRGPGEQWVEGPDIAHWGTNRGQVPTVLIAVDIVPEE